MAKCKAICWICYSSATTREHKSKKTDILPLFDKFGQAFFNSETKRNVVLQGPNSKLIKFGKSLCENCNGSLTQKYDQAWQALSGRLKSKILCKETQNSFKVAECFAEKHRVRRIRQVHLYFVKWLGCQLYEENVEFSQLGFSESLIDSKAHPNVYLKFGNSHRGDYVGQSDLAVNFTGKAINYAHLVYFAGQSVEVRVDYSRTHPSEFIELEGFWHPRMGTAFNFCN